MIDLRALLSDLRYAEGLRLTAYQDGCGVWTLGYGHTRGIAQGMTCTRAQADAWLMEDATAAIQDLKAGAPWAETLPEPGHRALAEMCYNLGWPRLSGFRKMLQALQERRYADAATEALDSKWATQVGNRAKRIAETLRGLGEREYGTA